jgi:hypothetical protein
MVDLQTTKLSRGEVSCTECSYLICIQTDTFDKCVEQVEHFAALHEHLYLHKVKQYVCFE